MFKGNKDIIHTYMISFLYRNQERHRKEKYIVIFQHALDVIDSQEQSKIVMQV